MDDFSKSVAGRVDGLLESRVAKDVAAEVGVSPAGLSNYRNAVRPIPLRVLPRLADTFGVRLSWLLTGDGHMRRTVEVFEGRALCEVDGLMENWDRPSTSKEDEATAEKFMASFRRNGGGGYAILPEVVRLLFTNLMARVFARLHEKKGHATNDAGWRGKVAGLELHRVKAAAQGAGFNTYPASTRKWIQAMGAEMEKWEREVPCDFEEDIDDA